MSVYRQHLVNSELAFNGSERVTQGANMRNAFTARSFITLISLLLCMPTADSQPAPPRNSPIEDLRSSADLLSATKHTAGATTVRARDARFGDVVQISGLGNDALHVNAMLRMNAGTISFWVKPHWKPASSESHALISARWNDPRASYLAISEGWWEPAGSGRLYFIASNEDFVNCSSDMRLPVEVWSLLTVTWTSGTEGYCKLYVDDELRATTKRSWMGGRSLDELYVGSDAAAKDRRGRPAQASFAALKILNYPLMHRDVMLRYQEEEDPLSLYSKKWAWLDPPDRKNDSRPRSRNAAVSNFKLVIFDEDMSWATSPAAIDERLRRIAEAGFNVYVPCVWHGRGTLFRSRAAPPDARLSDRMAQGWDPLAYLVEKAHARGIAVYPWFTVVHREDNSHPEWAEHGTPEGAYDVHQPGFRNFAVDLMLDVVTRYDIDGINLDYIRAMGVCTSDYCQRSYRARTGMDLLADQAAARDPLARGRIQSWQDEAVGSIVHDFADRARMLKPKLVISVDGHAVTAEDRRPLEGRDEIAWANRDWIDVVFDMDYRAVVDIEAERAARARLADSSKLWLLVGNYNLIDGSANPRSGKWLARVINFAQCIQRDKGLGIYIYSQLNDEQIQALRVTAPPSTRVPMTLADCS